MCRKLLSPRRQSKITRGNDLNGKHDEWEFTELMNIVWLGTIRGSFLDWNNLGGYFLDDSYPGWEFSV